LRRRNGFLAIAALVCSAALAGACAPAGPAATTPPAAPTPVDATPTSAGATATPAEASPEPEAATVRVGFHWTVPEPSWSGFITALELGYYEEENITVDFQYLQGSAIAVQQTGAGGVDLGVAGSDTIIGGIAEGLPLVVVANHLQNTPTGVIYPSDREISSFADFAGLRISTSAVGPEAPTLISRLEEAGLTVGTDVELVYVDPQAKCTVILTGETDACTGFNNFQLLQVQQEDPGAGFISFSTPEQPLIGHSIFANQSYAEQNGEVIRRFLRATMRGFIEADRDLDAALDHLIAANPEGDREFLMQGLEVTHEQLLRSERTDENGWGWMEDQPWQNFVDLLLSGEIIQEAVPASEIYTNDYLPEDRDF
jgi:NitT/TauT family transport system substrate-binding protein